MYVIVDCSMNRMQRAERFWNKVDKRGDDECWLWTASDNGLGYGCFWNGERQTYAHRFAYELLVGPIPKGLHLDHLCRTPSCVNPAHLEPVTAQINLLRGVGASARHAAKTHCPQGHSYDTIDTAGARRCSICLKEQWDRTNAKRPTTVAARQEQIRLRKEARQSKP